MPNIMILVKNIENWWIRNSLFFWGGHFGFFFFFYIYFFALSPLKLVRNHRVAKIGPDYTLEITFWLWANNMHSSESTVWVTEIVNYHISILLNIIKTKFYHFRHCICRRDGCDHGDMCEKSSDCGRDQWNRRGICVTDYKMKNNYGPWKLHK